MPTQNEIKAAAKSLRWLANQVPSDLSDSNEDKTLKYIKLYSTNGADILEKCAEKEDTKGMLMTVAGLQVCRAYNKVTSSSHYYCPICGQRLKS